MVWLRLPPSSKSDDEAQTRVEDCRQAFLVRKASEYIATPHKPSARLGGGTLNFRVDGSQAESGDAKAGWGSSGVAGGIGIDARRYVEGLLSLNR